MAENTIQIVESELLTSCYSNSIIFCFCLWSVIPCAKPKQVSETNSSTDNCVNETNFAKNEEQNLVSTSIDFVDKGISQLPWLTFFDFITKQRQQDSVFDNEKAMEIINSTDFGDEPLTKIPL